MGLFTFWRINMKIFKSLADLQQLEHDHLALPWVESHLKQLLDAYSEPGSSYDPENDGYLILIEQGDEEQPLTPVELNYYLINVPWEGVSLEPGYFYAFYLANNQFGLGFLIPDQHWLSPQLRQSLLEHVDE